MQSTPAGSTSRFSCISSFRPSLAVTPLELRNTLSGATAAAGYTCRSYNADLLYEPWEVLDNAGEPFHTFKTFWDK